MAQRFRSFALDPIAHPISGDLRSIIFKLSLDLSEDEVFSKLKSIYESSDFPEIQRDCLISMGRCKKLDNHAQMIEYTLFSGKVRLQDASFPFVTLASTSDEGGRACWKYFKNNYTKLESLYKNSPFWSSLVVFSCRGLKTLEEVKEITSFWNDPSHDAASGKRRLKQTLEVITTNAARLSRDASSVQDYLDTLFP